MDNSNDDNLALLEDLSGRIVKALDVLERKDWYAARLILADLWQELEMMFAESPSTSTATQPPPLSHEQRAELRKSATRLAHALRERPQSESQEMAQQLESIISE